LGQKIKNLRQGQKLSLQAMAEKTGLSQPVLSQIESEVVAPPVATLLKISKALNVNIGYFFQEEESGKRAVVVRKNERKQIFGESTRTRPRPAIITSRWPTPRPTNTWNPSTSSLRSRKRKIWFS